jgi:hypothetical protein
LRASFSDALLDLERDPEAGKRYRDHYVHLFHVFVFGLRIISGLIQTICNDKARKILKAKDEQFDGQIRGYNAAGKEINFMTTHGNKECFIYGH